MDVVGAAAGVLQVAEVGFSLAKTLYEYAASVKGAEKDIRKVARDVKLTSKVLQRTHEQIKNDQQAQLCTEDALLDLEDVLEGCKEAFEEVDQALRKSMRTTANGKSTISVAEKLKWPLKSNKIEVLRANLEKLKTTLLLMLSVLAYGSRMANQARSEEKLDLSLEKLQIQSLVQAKDEATQRYAELSVSFTELEERINKTTANAPHSVIQSLPAMPQAQRSNSPSQSRDDGNHPSIDPLYTAMQLSLCASAVSRLTTTIHTATQKWHMHQILDHHRISESLQEASNQISHLEKHSELEQSSAPAIHAADPYLLHQHSQSSSPRVLRARNTALARKSREWKLAKRDDRVADVEAELNKSKVQTSQDGTGNSPNSRIIHNDLSDALDLVMEGDPNDFPVYFHTAFNASEVQRCDSMADPYRYLNQAYRSPHTPARSSISGRIAEIVDRTHESSFEPSELRLQQNFRKRCRPTDPEDVQDCQAAQPSIMCTEDVLDEFSYRSWPEPQTSEAQRDSGSGRLGKAEQHCEVLYDSHTQRSSSGTFQGRAPLEAQHGAHSPARARPASVSQRVNYYSSALPHCSTHVAQQPNVVPQDLPRFRSGHRTMMSKADENAESDCSTPVYQQDYGEIEGDEDDVVVDVLMRRWVKPSHGTLSERR